MVVQISYLNRATNATLSSGQWQPTLPLNNLKVEGLRYPARSLDATLASTFFDVDLGDTYVTRLVGFMRYNLSLVATWRIYGGDAPGVWSYDSGEMAAWEAIYGPLDLDFEEDDWWAGLPSEEDRALYPRKLLKDLGSNVNYRYWRIVVTDTTNASGYIDLTRLWIGSLVSPQVNYDWGAPLGWVPRDRAAVTLSGARYSDRKTPARVFKMTFSNLKDAEAFGRLQDMMRVLGSEGELIVIPDASDTLHRHVRDLYCRVISWGEGAAHRALDTHSVTISLEELL